MQTYETLITFTKLHEKKMLNFEASLQASSHQPFSFTIIANLINQNAIGWHPPIIGGNPTSKNQPSLIHITWQRAYQPHPFSTAAIANHT